MSALEFRPYKYGDEEHILSLFEKAYKRKLSKEYWRWRFLNNPMGRGVIELAWDGSVLVGHYALSRIDMNVYGSAMKTGLSGTTMTSPGYRGMNIFSVLGKRCYKRFQEQGGKFVWGFPNNLIHRSRSEKLGWVDIYEIPMLCQKTKDIKTHGKYGDNVIVVTTFDNRFNELWNRVRDDHRVITIRNASFLNWRYIENPLSNKYIFIAYVDNNAVLGYVVLNKFNNRLQVIDILFENHEEIWIGLFNRIIEIAFQEELEYITLWFNVSHPFHHYLERLGFVNTQPIFYLGGKLLNSDVILNNIYDYRYWYISSGDSDIF